MIGGSILKFLGLGAKTASLVTGSALISAFVIFLIMYIIERKLEVSAVKKLWLYWNLSLTLLSSGIYLIFMCLLMNETVNPDRALLYYRLAYLFGMIGVPLFFNVVLNLTIGNYKDVLRTKNIKDGWKKATKYTFLPMWGLTIFVWIINCVDIFFKTDLLFEASRTPISNSMIPLIPGVSKKVSFSLLIEDINPFYVLWGIALIISITIEISYMIRVIWFDKGVISEKKGIFKVFDALQRGLKDRDPIVKWIKTFSFLSAIALFCLFFQGIIGYDWENSFPIVAYSLILVFFAIIFVLFGEIFQAREETLNAYTEVYNKNLSSRMLRTIGHEMSQPIMLISGFFNRLRSDFEKMKKHNLVGFSREDLENHLDDLNEKEKAVKRIANVMEDLKKQAGIYKTEIKLVLINPIIKQTAKIENFDTKGKEFKILVNTDEIIDEIRIDEEQMHVILKNIIENSIDALPDKNGIIKVTSKLNKEHVLITIEDNGKGIPYKMHNRVIEPFITTKRKGTGLGLTIVRNFLKEINGSFDVFSEVNKGTTIKIKIPYK